MVTKRQAKIVTIKDMLEYVTTLHTLAVQYKVQENRIILTKDARTPSSKASIHLDITYQPESVTVLVLHTTGTGTPKEMTLPVREIKMPIEHFTKRWVTQKLQRSVKESLNEVYSAHQGYEILAKSIWGMVGRQLDTLKYPVNVLIPKSTSIRKRVVHIKVEEPTQVKNIKMKFNQPTNKRRYTGI